MESFTIGEVAKRAQVGIDTVLILASPDRRHVDDAPVLAKKSAGVAALLWGAPDFATE
jgi:hypothetical protein